MLVGDVTFPRALLRTDSCEPNCLEHKHKSKSEKMLHALCGEGNDDALRDLLTATQEQHGDDRVLYLVNQKNSEKYTPLNVALFSGYVL
ncbi:hypothetical protein EON64_16045 [archaeon]|nr:MAG: hypothetical protein EON64_16045 [archaeon]